MDNDYEIIFYGVQHRWDDNSKWANTNWDAYRCVRAFREEGHKVWSVCGTHGLLTEGRARDLMHSMAAETRVSPNPKDYRVVKITKVEKTEPIVMVHYYAG